MTPTADSTVSLEAGDPISEAGIAAALAERGVAVTSRRTAAGQTVVIVAECVDEQVRQRIRRARRGGARGVVLVVSRLDDEGLYAAVEAGASALLQREDATPQRLSAAIRDAASGRANLPPDLLGRLLSQVSQLYDQVLEPQGMHLGGLTDRETEVLRLVADGHATAEIARRLSYSERTIKNVIQTVTTRLQLRNRSHAVAYAVRHGLI